MGTSGSTVKAATVSVDVSEKLIRILRCPSCHTSISFKDNLYICQACSEKYRIVDGLPILIPSFSSVLSWYTPQDAAAEDNAVGRLARYITPEYRVWTHRSLATLRRALSESSPDANNSFVILIGSGLESEYRKLLAPFQSLMRIGLAHRGEVDVASDLCHLPVASGSTDLIMSSSVLEHVYDPERAIREMFRVLKPGGKVYAEVPFMRSYHMAPRDYQRYTISGLKEVFERNGFTTLDSGVCSGPFTAIVLFVVDIVRCVVPPVFSKFGNVPLLWRAHVFDGAILACIHRLLHPIKYLDRLCEDKKWSHVIACNFFYMGEK